MAARFYPPRPARRSGAGLRIVRPVHVMPRPALRLVQLAALDCAACGLHAGPFLTDEANQLAGTHDDLHHGGRPTAVVSNDHDPRPVYTVTGQPDGPTLGGAA